MKKWLYLLITLIVAVSVGCSNTEIANQVEAPQTQEQEVLEEVEEELIDSFPITITDALGNEVTIEQQPERIVTLIPSITETVFALDRGDLLVGRTDWCNYPEAVFDIESVGGMQFDVEKLLSLKPDLVLSHASGAHSSQEGLDQLRNAGLTVVVVSDAKSLQDVLDVIEFIGLVIGASEEALNVTSTMAASFQELAEKAQAVTEEEMATVWVEVSPSPDIYTTGQGTFMHEMLELLNARNAAGDLEGWIKFTEEDAVILNPDIIITTYGYYVEDPEEEVKNRQGWQEVTAVKNGRVVDVHSDKVTRSGPRLAEGVEELAVIIYPEIFNK